VARRLGNILYWLSCILPIVIVVWGVHMTDMALSSPTPFFDPSQTLLATAIVAFLVWRFGRACRYQETMDRLIDPRLLIILGVGVASLWAIFGECDHIFWLDHLYYPRREPFCAMMGDMVVFGIWYHWIFVIGIVLVLRGVYRLFREPRRGTAGEPTLRVAHDAVFVSWPRAEEATRLSDEFYRVRAEIERAFRRWQEGGEQNDRLIPPGIPLVEAEKLVSDFKSELFGEFVRFVTLSRKWAQAQQRRVAACAVSFVMIAEMLLYVPLIASFRVNWLNDRLRAAHTAALELDVPTGSQPVPDVVARRILGSINAHAVAMKMGESRRLLAAADPIPQINDDFDMRDVGNFTSIVDAFKTMLGTKKNDVMRVVAPVPMGGQFVEIITDEPPLRTALLRYSGDLLLISLLVSGFTGLLTYFTLGLTFVRTRYA
jgi:hypothetical protein